MYSNQSWKQTKNRSNPRKKQSKTQEFNNNHIAEELLEHILIQLPIKSLLRFKSVCKTWRSLIQSQPFINIHRRFHADDHFRQLIVSPTSTSEPIASPDGSIEVVPGPLDDLALPPEMTRFDNNDDVDDFYLKWRSVARTLGPLSNGIYCLIVYRRNKFGRILVSSTKTAVCNPATREFKVTNPFPTDSRSLLCERDQWPSRVHYGFGSVPKTSSSGLDYKIVVVINWGSRYKSFLCFVYSVQRGMWKKVVDFEDGKRDRSKRKVVRGLALDGNVHYPEIEQDLELCPQRFFKGCWHWMATVEFDNSYNVLSFNVANDEFKLIAGPQGYYYENHPMDLCVKAGVLVLGDSLVAIYVTQPSFVARSHLPVESLTATVDVWLMSEYGVEESWSHVYTIDTSMNRPISRFVGLNARSANESDKGGRRMITTMFFEDDKNQFVSCDDELGFKEHGVYNISSSICWNNLVISTYEETLESL